MDDLGSFLLLVEEATITEWMLRDYDLLSRPQPVPPLGLDDHLEERSRRSDHQEARQPHQ